MKTLLTIVLGPLLGCMACSTNPYFGPGTGSAPASAPSVAPIDNAMAVVLTAEQVAAVRAHYAGASNSNGRGRNGGLPPGIARNLARGKALPPGIAKQYLPRNLQAALPVLETGLDYVVAAGKLLLVEAATQIVRDVLIDVVYG